MYEHKTFAIQGTYRSIAAQKGVLTSRIRVANDTITMANVGTAPSAAAVDDLHRIKSKMAETFDKIEDLYALLFEHDPDNLQAHENSLANENVRFRDIRAAVNTALQRSRPAVQAQPGDAATTTRTPPARVDDSLKPFELTKEHSPMVMRS